MSDSGLNPHQRALVEAFMHNEASEQQLCELYALISANSAAARQVALSLTLNSMIAGRLRAEADGTFVAECAAAVEKRAGDSKFVRKIMDRVCEVAPAAERGRTTRNLSPVRVAENARTRASERLPQKKSGDWQGWLTGAAIAALFALYLFARILSPLGSSVPAIATISSGSTKGYIFRERQRYPLTDGSEVADGDIVQSGTGLQFNYLSDPGTKITLAPDTKVRIAMENGAKRVVLLSGKIEAEVTPQAPGQAMVLTTVHAEVKVVGTRFTLQEDPFFTKVEVLEGKVRMTRRLDKAEVDVPVGHAASADSAAAAPLAVAKMDAIEQGLIGRWRFDDGAGESAQNEFGPAASARVSRWVQGRDGLAASLNGTSDYVNFGTSPALNFAAGTAFTYAGWFKTTSGFGMLVSQRNSNDEGAVIDIGIGRNGGGTAEGRLMALIRPNGPLVSPYCQVTGGQANDGAWHHFAITRQPDGTLTLYLDGVLQGTHRTPLSSGPITTNYRVAGYEHFWQMRGMMATYFNGSLDDIRIYDRALKAPEIQQLAK